MWADYSVAKDNAQVVLVTSEKAQHVRVAIQPGAGLAAVLHLTLPEALNLHDLLTKAIARASQ